MKTDPEFPCPCDSQRPYLECCGPYHKGKPPLTAQALMRARYSAYALSKADFIVKTTHPDNPGFIPNQSEWIDEIIAHCQHTQFTKLEILDVEEGENESFVTFTAHFEREGQAQAFTEKSRFRKVAGLWLYLDGIFLPQR